MTADDALRYARQIALGRVGVTGQARLAGARAGVVGLGGLGSVASLYLASSGIGALCINDFDRIDASNLPRQILFRSRDVGAPKASVTAAALREVNPALQLRVLDRRLDAAGLADALHGCDVVLDCSDNFATRHLLNRVCVALRRPLVSGAVIRFEGQVAMFANDGDGPCYRCLYAEDDEPLGDCSGQGVLAPVAGTVGTMMATEAIAQLLGLGPGLRNHLWFHDALAGQSRRVRIRRAPACPVCAAPGSSPAVDGRRQSGA